MEYIGSLIIGKDDKGVPVELPADPTQKLAIIAVSGAGKSYAAGLMVEQWNRWLVPVAVLDPVGIWWGLRSPAEPDKCDECGTQLEAEWAYCGDCGSERFRGLPFWVYGGPHGDGPLPHPGRAAHAFSELTTSMVLDLSELTVQEIHLWTAEFCEYLMSAGVCPTFPCHIVFEEAPIFIPQKGSNASGRVTFVNSWGRTVTVSAGQKCKLAMGQLVRVGGNRGYGVTLISQRAALVDKDLLTQCQNLLLLRLAAAIDRRAITDWVASNSAQIDVKRSLAEFSELPNGVGYLWAPNWLTSGGSSYSKVHIGRRKTLHPLGILMDPKPMLPIRDVEPEMI